MKDEQRLCEIHWDADDIVKMKEAIRENYYYEFVIGTCVPHIWQACPTLSVV
jgi:hypothetical protein